MNVFFGLPPLLTGLGARPRLNASSLEDIRLGDMSRLPKICESGTSNSCEAGGDVNASGAGIKGVRNALCIPFGVEGVGSKAG